MIKIPTLGQGPEFEKWLNDPAYKGKLSFYDIFRDYMEKILLTFVLEKEKGKYTDKEGVLVIFIDDLDRCPPKKITKVLESINLFFDQEGCFFIFGTDISLISKAIGLEYKEMDGFSGSDSGSDYLKKMIQLQFDLPSIRKENIKEFMKGELKIGGPLKTYCDIIIKGIEGNPREIKRFLNSLNLMSMLGESIKNMDYEEELLIKWSIINFTSDDFIREVKRKHRLLIYMQSISGMRKKEVESFLETLDEYDKKLCNRFKNDEKILGVLKSGDKKFEETDIQSYIFLSSVAPKEPEETKEVKTGPHRVKSYRIEPGAYLEEANLKRANLKGANLRGANLEGADLRGADLLGAYLRGADLEGANLWGADLKETNLRRANLKEANLRGANLGGANLEGVDLKEANLRRADLRRANLEGAIFKNASLDENCLKTILESRNWEGARFDEDIRKKLEDMKKQSKS